MTDRELDPGSFFGEVALVRRGTRSATVVAVEPVEAVPPSARAVRRHHRHVLGRREEAPRDPPAELAVEVVPA